MPNSKVLGDLQRRGGGGAQRVVMLKELLSLWSMAPRRNGVKHASLCRQSLLTVPESQKQCYWSLTSEMPSKEQTNGAAWLGLWNHSMSYRSQQV